MLLRTASVLLLSLGVFASLSAARVLAAEADARYDRRTKDRTDE